METTETDPISPSDAHARRVSARGQDRRDRKSRFHLPERRTGFDRRERYPVTGALRERPATLGLVLLGINALSALDFALTYAQLEAGVSTEANPVMAQLFAQGAGYAWAIKTLVVLAVTISMWAARKYRAVLLLAVLTLVVYATLIIYHIVGMRATGLI
jgi:hypothetical protein